MLERNTIVFVEVKARRVFHADWPVVRHAQTVRIRRAARGFRKHYRVERNPFRFDVVTVELRDGTNPGVRWIRTNPRSDSSRTTDPRE